MSVERFIAAQEKEYAKALTEIKRGRKTTHWIWYVFPQIAGLGFSETSKFYAIKNIAEAGAFLDDPLLGGRLKEICGELLLLPGNNATAIFGNPDDMKLKSSMTLFAMLQPTDAVFQSVLDKFFDGMKDENTLRIIREMNDR
jgi:uncharacterized protein (DUF1810 family)